MTRIRKKAQTWHLKGALGLVAVFAAGLLVSGALGGVSPFGTTSNGDTGTGTSSISSGSTDTTSSSSSSSSSVLSYIVTFAQGTSSADQASEIAAAGANLVSAIAPLSMDSIDVSSGAEDGVVAALQANPNVVDVERDRSRETDAAPNDPGYADQWNLPMVGWDQIYDPLNPTGNSTLAVLDTGVSGSTGDLSLGPGWSAFGTDPTNDSNGHGTAVASIAAATAGNGIGIAGVNFGATTILPVQVLGADGLGQDSDIIEGVVWAADHGANVIVMSFSNTGYSQALQDAINYAWGKGAVVVAATGNDGSDSPTYPAGDADVMGVSGTDQSDQPWASSNTGEDTFIAAPATSIPADATDGSETSITGTSASAAEVAGAAALLMANDSNATNAIVDGRLGESADPVGTTDQTGNGRLNIANAIADTSTDGVTPLGAPGGGPFVGPYRAAAAYTWTGATSTDWGDPTNWSGTRTTPATNDDLTIPSSVASNRFPTISSGSCTATPSPCVVHNLTLQGQISQTGGTLKINGNANMAGSYNATGGTVEFTSGNNNWTVSGGTQFFHVLIDSGNNVSLPTTTKVAGDWTNNSSATTGQTIEFNGTGAQAIGGTSATTFSGLTVNNSGAGVTLQNDVTATGALSLANGHVTTSTVAYSPAQTAAAITTTIQTAIAVSGTAIQTGDIIQIDNEQMLVTGGGGTINLTVTRNYLGSGAATHSNGASISHVTELTANGTVTRTNGYVVGNLRRPVTATNLTWDVGNGSDYTPFTATFSSVTPTPTMTVRATAGENPNTGSGIDQSHDVNTYWSIASTGTMTIGSPTFKYSDIDSGSVASSFIAKRWSGSSPWNAVAISGTPTATQTVASGITTSTLGQFAIGDATGTIADHIVLSGSAADLPSGSTKQITATIVDSAGNTVTTGSDSSLSITYSKSSGTGSVTGLGSATAVGGVANLTVTGNLAGSISIHAAATGSTGAISSPTDFTFNVVAGTASKIVLSGSTGDLASGSQRTYTATIEDAAGNTVNTGANSTSAISFSQTGGTGSVSFATASSTSGGVATDVVTGVLKGTPTIRASATLNGNSTNSNTLSFNVVAGPATHIVLSGGTADLASGSPRTFTATIEDAAGNTVDNSADSTDPISFSQTGGTGTVSFATPSATSNGVATVVVQGVLKGSVTIRANASISGHGSVNSNTLSFNVVAGPASQVVLSGVNADLASGSTKTLTATIEDAAGNTVDNSADSTRAISFSQNGGTGSVSFATPSSTSGGVATDVVQGVLKGSVSIHANATLSGPGSVNSNTLSFNVVAGPASQVVLSGSNADLASGLTKTLTATIEDAAGNTVDNSADSTRAISFSQTGGTGTVSFATPSSTSGGVATDVVTGVLKGTVQIRATALLSGPGSTTSNTFSFNVVAGPAAQVALSGGTGGLTSGSSRTYTATIEDAAGNAVDNSGDSTDAISFSQTGGTGSVSFATPSSTSGGVATDAVTGNLAGSVSIQANAHLSGPGSTNSNTLSFSVVHGAAAKLAFSAQPNSSYTADDTIHAKVAIEDAAGNVVDDGPDASDSVAVALGGPSATLFGTLTQPASNGVASFDDLQVHKVGTGYFLHATSGSLTAKDSSMFDITPGAATHLKFDQQPTTTVAGQTIAPAVSVDILDQYNNVETGDNATQVSLAIGNNPSAGTLSGTTPETASGGIASFGDLSIDHHGIGYTLNATSNPTLTGDQSSAFDITARSTNTSVSCTSPVDAGATTTCTATVTDTNGAGSSTPTGTVNFSSDGSGSFSPLASCTLSSGSCSVSYTPDASDDAGTQNIGAVYTGSNIHAGSTATDFPLNVTTHATLAITKGAAPTTVHAGTDVTYTLTISNSGPSDARGVTVSDPLASPLTGASYTVDGGSSSAWGGSAGIGTITPGAHKTVVITATVPADTDPGSHILNTASASSPTDVNSPESSNTTDTLVDTQANLSITKEDGVSSVLAGGPGHTYTITVSNTGPSDARDVSVADVWPSGFAQGTVNPSQGSCDTVSSAPNFSCSLGTVPAGGSATITAAYTVPSSTQGDQTNTATVSSSTTNTSSTTSASDTDHVTTEADLSIVKAGPTDVTAGTGISYLLTVHNGGESDARNVMVSDPLSPGADYLMQMYSVDGDTASPYSGSVSLGDIAAGATHTIEITATVASFVPDGTVLTNQATVGSDTFDQSLSNNTSDVVSTTVNAKADIADLKVSDADPVVAGTKVTYTITVNNSAGPSDAQNVSLSDTLDPELSNAKYCVGSSCDPSTGGAFSSPLALGTIAQGNSVVVRIQADLSPSDLNPTLSNTATASSTTQDPNPANNSSTADVTVATEADLSITKAGPASVVAGNDIEYTLTVDNAGPSDAQHVAIADSLPAGLDDATYSVVGGNNGSGAYSSPLDIGTIPAGGSAVVTIDATVNHAVLEGAILTNDASVSSGTSDPDTSNNGPKEVNTTVHAIANVSIAKTGDSNVTAGTPIHYNLHVSNPGPSDAQNVVVSDSLPSGESNATYTIDGGSSQSWSGSTSFSTLAAGDSHDIAITADTSPSLADGSTLANTATVASDTTNNSGVTSSEKDTTVHTSADLSIAKGGPSTTIAGDPSGLDYTFAVHNGGPSDNTGGFVISDTLPSDLTYVSGTAGCSASGQLVTCTNTSGLAFGAADAVYSIHVKLASSAEGTLSNSASVASSGTSDLNNGNNTDTTTATIAKDVHLHVVKTFQSDTVTAGGASKTFTIAVSNTGFSDADNLEVTDSVDPRLIVTNIADGGLDCSTSAGQNVDCTAAHLVSGDTKTITVTYKVDTTTEAATVSNSATATSSEDSQSGSDTVDIVKDVELQVTKHFASPTVTAGDPTGSSFTITAKNIGVSRGDELQINDAVPNDLIVTGVSGSAELDCTGSSGQFVHCTEANVAAGEQQSVTVDYRVDTNTDAETVSNTATATTDETSNDGSDSVQVVEDVQLAITKHFDSASVTAGGAAQTFTVTVKNNGLSRADNVVVDDTVDPRLQVTGTSGGFSCGSGNSVHCTLAHLASGDTKTLVVTYDVDTTTEGDPSVSNTAFAQADETVGQVQASDHVAIVKDVQLAVTKTFADHTVTSGGAASSFQIDVKNNGVSRADNVAISDNVDSRLIVDSIDAGDYTCAPASQSISCSIAHLNAGDTKSITVHFHVAPDTHADPSVGNSASATSDEVSTPATGSDSVAIVKDVQLSSTKSFADTQVTAGGTPSSFTLSVTNSGVSTADNVHLTDNVPSDLIVDSVVPGGSFDCGADAAQNVDCSLGTLAHNATETVTVNFHVDTTTEAETLHNTGHVSSDENNAGVDSNTASVEVIKDVQLQVSKLFADGAVDAGTGGHTFTIDVKNTGVSRADNLDVTDLVDSRLHLTNVASGQLDCSTSSGQQIDCSAAHLAAGVTDTITGTYSVASGTAADPSVTNQAHASTAETSQDSNVATVAITTHADVADLKVQTGSNIAGDNITYTSTIQNNGPSDAQAVTFSDPLDSHLDGAQYCVTLALTCTPGTAWPNGNSISIGTIVASQTYTVVITAQIDPSTPEGYDLTNTSTANSGTTTDPNPNNNQSSTDTTVDTQADLSLAKSGPSSTIAGDPAGFDYTLTATNHGPSDNTGGFTVVDTLPSGVSFDSSPDACVDSGSGTVTCTNSTGLAAGGTQAFHLHVKASQTLETTDTLHNSATVSSSGTLDPNSANDTATFDTSVTKDVELAITKQFNSATVTAGGASQSFEIDVTNNGVSQADGVEVTDSVDSRLHVDGTTGDFNCGAASQSLDCTLAHIAAGQTKSIVVTYHVAPDVQPATVDNSASVTTSDEPNPIGSGNVSVDVVTSADLTLAKTAPASAIAGDPAGFDYILKVTNNGPSDNTGGFTVSDDLPSGTTFSATGSDNRCSAVGQAVTCTRASGLALNGTDSFTVHVTASQRLESTDNLDNTATVASNGTDNPANGDSASSSTSVVEDVELAISKQFADTSVVAGGAGSHFSIDVTNNGFTDAENVVVTDKVDSRLIIDSVSGDFGSCAQTPESGDTLLTCTLPGTLDSIATKSISVAFHVADDTAPAASVGNSASVTAEEEPNAVTSSTSVAIDTAADLTVAKAGPSSPVTAGDPAGFDYTLTVTNNGPSVQTGGFHVTDNLDSNLTFQGGGSSSGCSASSQLVTCSSSGSLAVDGAKTFTVHVTLDPSAEETYDLQNKATVFSDGTTDPNTGNDGSNVTHTQIAEDVHLSLTKSFADSHVVAGDAASSFTLKVHNSGLSTADAVEITDAVPGTLQVDSIDNNSFNCGASSGQSVDCTLAHLAPGADASITVHYHVASSALPGSVQNDASVSSEEGVSDSATASVTVDRNVSLSVTKTFSPKTVIAGGTPGQFTIQVTNNGPSDASNVSLTDNVDSRLGVTNLSSSDFSCGSPSNSISCSLGALGAGDSASVVVTYSVDSTVEPDPSVANHAFASSTEQPTAAEGSDSVEIDRSVNLQLTKLFQDGSVQAGTTGHTFTLEVKNSGPSQADNVQVSDNVNSLLQVTNVIGGGFTCNTGQSISCSIPTLAAGGDKTITVTYSVASSTAAQTVSNSANASSAEGATASNTTSVDIATKADVADVKDVSAAPQIAGDTITYTSTISNPTGPSDAAGVVFTDTLDGNLTNAVYCVDSTPCTPTSNPWPGSIALGTIPVGSQAVVVITATISPSTPAGYPLDNTSSETSSTPDDNTGNDSSTVHSTVTTQADLSVSKSGPSDAVAGDPAGFDYTVSVHNHGPSDNTGGFSVTDNLPSGLTFQSGGTTDPRCGASGGIVTCTNSSGLAAGSDDSFTFHVTVASNIADGTVLSNNASVAANGTNDPTPGNNSTASPTQTTIHALADLTVSKGGPSSATAGSAAGFDYTFDVHNGGPSDHVGDLHVTDTLDSRLSFQSSGSSAGCSASGQVVTCTSTDPLPAGGHQMFTVHVTLASSATGSVSNSASVASGGTTDPTPGNNGSGTVTTTIDTSANLAITKDDGVSSVVAGGSGHTYTITVTNSGPSDALNVSVADSWPAGFNKGAVIPAQGSCNAATSFTCSLGTIAAGGSATITAAYTVPSSTTGDQTNSATASSSTPANSPSASDTDHVTLQSDLAITKTDNVMSATPGTSTTYTVVATNNGPSDVTGAVVADNPPPAITSDSWTATSSGGAAGFSAAGSGSINDTVNMPSGSTITYTITANISAAATGSLSNTATITAPAGVTDASGNNSATDTDTLNPSADLSVTKTDGTGTAVPGLGTTYTIVVSNSGPSVATGSSVTDNLPSAVTSDSWAATQSGGATGFSSTGSGNIHDTAVNLPVGSSVTYTLTANIDQAATGSLSNTASVATGSGTTDPNPGNNSATDTDTLNPQSDLNITKDDHTTTAVPGMSTTYTIVVTNNGPSAASGAAISDPLASNTQLSSDSYTSVASAGASGNTASGTGSISDTVNMASGSSITYTVVANVKSSATGTLTNTATATIATDNVAGNNSATDTDTLTPHADLAVSKTGPASATAGTNVTYTITVTNGGPSDNAGFSVSDTLPSGLSFVSSTGSCTGTSTVTCTSAGLANGGTASWQITANVASTFAGSSITNTASIASNSTTDNNSSNDHSSATTTINTSANLSITKSGPATATAGTAFSYTIVVANAGPSAAQNVQVTDVLPASFSNATYTVDGGPSTAYSSPISLGTMDSSGASSSHTIVITGTPTLAATITNQASVSSTTGDPSAANNTSATVSTVVSAGPASKLVFVQQPTDTAAESPITPAVTVQVTDQNGNATATPGVSIGMAITTGTGTTGATLSGTTSQTTNANGLATFNGLSIDLAGGGYQLTASSTSYGSVPSSPFNITPGTLLSQVATADANWQNKIDGADVLFGPSGPGGTGQSLKNTNPGSFHWQLTLQNETGVQLHDPGVAINTKNGGHIEVWLTIPQLPTNLGTTAPPYATQYQAANASAFVTQGPNAINIRPGPGGPPAGPPAPVGPPGPGGGGPNMQFHVAYIVGGGSAPTDCTTAGSAFNSSGQVQGQWIAGEPPDGTNVKCIYASGLNLPPHGNANMDLNLQTVLAAKGNSGWASNAQNLFRAGFPFRSVATITLDSDFGLMCKPPNGTNCSDPHGFNAAYGGKKFSGPQALGLVLAGKQVTAIGGYAFDQNAFGIPGANVLLFNSAAAAGNPANCSSPATNPNVVAWTTTQADGFYFIENQGFNDVTPPNPDPNNLPFNVQYYVAVCNVPGVSPVNWPARLESQKLGNKQFDEEDFFISPTTSVVFTKQPTNTKSGNAFNVSAQLQDAFGQTVPNDTTTPITLTPNMNSMTCTPSNSQAQTGGVANFSCKITVVANNYQLTASAPSLKSSTSNFFNITK